MVWGFGALGISSKPLFGRIASELETAVAELNTQDLVAVAWAFAVTGCGSDGFMGSVETTAVARTDMDASQLVTISWALSKAGNAPRALVDKMLATVSGGIQQMSAQNLSELAWVLSQQSSLEGALVDAAVVAIGSRLSEFNAPQLVDVAVACGKIGSKAEALLGQIAAQVQQALSSFKPADICSIAMSLAGSPAVHQLAAFETVLTVLKQALDNGTLGPPELLNVYTSQHTCSF